MVDRRDNCIDSGILHLVQSKEQRGMKLLFDNYFDEIFKYIFKLVGNREDTEDILQTVFMDLWQNAHNREIKNLKGYLIKMSKFQVYKLWSQKENLGDLLDEYNDAIIEDTLQHDLESKEIEQEIQKAVSTLPEACKNIFELSKVEGLSLDEIAFKLNLSKQTVKKSTYKSFCNTETKN